MSQQVNSIPSLMMLISDRLQKTILALESDQIIQQMRNDKTLYQYKMTHIKQIIEEHFNFQKQLTQLLQQNQQLRTSISTLQIKMSNKDRQFTQAIDMIEQSAKKHTIQKQQQLSKLHKTIQTLQQKLLSQHQLLQKSQQKSTELIHKSKQISEQNEKLKKQLHKQKQQNIKLNQINKKYKVGFKESQLDREKSVHGLRMEYQKEIQEYEGLVKKMQGDMVVIKGEWQKKCADVERSLREFYEGEMLKMEQKKTRQLIQHIQSLKQGKPIIIKQDQQILTTRISSIRHKYQSQISQLQLQNKDLTQLYQSLQNNQLPKIKQIQTLNDTLKTLRSQFEIQKQNWINQKDKSKREIEKLKAIVLEFQRNSKDAILGCQAKEAEMVKLGDQVRFVERKLEIANRSIGQYKNALQSKQDELQKMKTKIADLTQASKKNKKTIETLQSQLQKSSKKSQNLQKQLDMLTTQQKQQSQLQTTLKTQIKSLKSSKQKYRKILDKLTLQLKHIQKQSILLKEDIKYGFQLNRKKNVNDFQRFVEQVRMYQDGVQKQCRKKMNDLINQIQEAKELEHGEFEAVVRERDNLKRDVVQLEALFDKKQREVEDAKRSIINAQVDQVKRAMLQQLQRQRIKYQRLQDDLIQNQQKYHRLLQRTKTQIKDSIRTVTSKWTDQLSRLQQQNKRKQHDFQHLLQKTQQVITESTEIKQNYQLEKEEIKRLRKKYDTLKQEKQEQINDLIKRLERQSKHKINLEKQLRSIRAQLNCKDRGEDGNGNGKGLVTMVSTDRQREITEIRELIAKTYQAVGQKPEKDFKLQRKRSPY